MGFSGEYDRVCVCVCVSGPQQCLLCGNLAQEECVDCFKDPVFSQAGFKLFCETCSAQVCLTLEVFCLHYQSVIISSAAIFTQLL